MAEETVLTQINELQGLSLNKLQQRYEELFNENKALPRKPESLRRKIAYRIQELAYGGLSQKAQDKIHELITIYDPINNKALRQVNKAKQQTSRVKRDIRLPIPGAIITKIYKGIEIKVSVLDKGFEYNGRIFKTLSQIANCITGAHWNGYLFFGI